MAKEKPVDPERQARKAEKHARKEAKRSDSDGVHKTKKEKIIREQAIGVDTKHVKTTANLLNKLEAENPGSVALKEDEGQELEVQVKTQPFLGALVPFATTLAEEKTAKKLFKSVKKGLSFTSTLLNPLVRTKLTHFSANKVSALKRGVKEVVKAVRKSPLPAPSSTFTPSYICILAADISPMDVISHIPVLCEDHGIPYMFVPSRAELGAASQTKRPTSVVLIAKEAGKLKKRKEQEGEEVKKDKEEKEEDWGEIYGDVLKVVKKAGRGMRI